MIIMELKTIWLYLISVILISNTTVETHVTDTSFDIVEQGQIINGRIGAERTARRNIECSSMCLSDDLCKGYHYQEKRAGSGKCTLIHNGCLKINGPILTYRKVSSVPTKFADKVCQNGGTCVDGITCTCVPGYIGSFCETNKNECAEEPCMNGGTCKDGVNDYSCTCASGYLGLNCQSVLYWSCDTSDGFVLMEGTQEMGSVPLVAGKVNSAWSLDRTKRQWIDLGIHTEACMTRPETCGAAGGAISLWVNLIDCPASSGIVSSFHQLSGSLISYYFSIKFSVHLTDGYFEVYHPKSSGWTHLVLNYIGPNEGEGIIVYKNGQEVESDTSKHEVPSGAGDGKIVVGRRYTGSDNNYASVEVDELNFSNQALTHDQVQAIYNSV